jgi:hypothetical protein
LMMYYKMISFIFALIIPSIWVQIYHY